MSGYRVLGMESEPTSRSTYYVDDYYSEQSDRRSRCKEQVFTTPRRPRRQQRDDDRVNQSSKSNQYRVRDKHVYQSTPTQRDVYLGYPYTTQYNHTFEEYDDEEIEDSGMTYFTPPNQSFRNLMFVQDDPDWIPPYQLPENQQRYQQVQGRTQQGEGGTQRVHRDARGINSKPRQRQREDAYAQRVRLANSEAHMSRSQSRLTRTRRQPQRVEETPVYDAAPKSMTNVDSVKVPHSTHEEQSHQFLNFPAIDPLAEFIKCEKRIILLEQQIADREARLRAEDRDQQIAHTTSPLRQERYNSHSCTSITSDVRVLATGSNTCIQDTECIQSGGQEQQINISTVDECNESSKEDNLQAFMVGSHGAYFVGNTPMTACVQDEEEEHQKLPQSMRSPEQLQKQGYVSNLSPSLNTKVCASFSELSEEEQVQEDSFGMLTSTASQTSAFKDLEIAMITTPTSPRIAQNPTDDGVSFHHGDRDLSEMPCQEKGQTFFTNDGMEAEFQTEETPFPEASPDATEKDKTSEAAAPNASSYSEVQIGSMIIPLKQPIRLHQHPCDQKEFFTSSGTTVSPQCLHPLSFGQFHSITLLKEVAMDENNPIFNRPWQSIQRVLLAAYMNTCVFTYHGKHVSLSHLPCFELSQDQVSRTSAHDINAFHNALSFGDNTFDPGDSDSRQQQVSTTTAVNFTMRCTDKCNVATQDTALQELGHQKELHRAYRELHLREFLNIEVVKCEATTLNDDTNLSFAQNNIDNRREGEFTDQRVHCCITRSSGHTKWIAKVHNGGRLDNKVSERVIIHLRFSSRPPPKPNGTQGAPSTGTTVSRQCTFPYPFMSPLVYNSFPEMTLGVLTILLGRPVPSSHVLHVEYLNTLVFTYHVKHVTKLSYIFCENLRSQAKYLHHKAWPSERHAFKSTRSSQVSGASPHLPSLRLHRRRHPTAGYGVSPNKAMKFADHTRMKSHSGTTVPWQCLIPLFDQCHASTLNAMLALDTILLLLGCPGQVRRCVLRDWYINTSVFTYHRKNVTFSSLPFLENSQELVKIDREETVPSRMIASTSTRHHWETRCACKTKCYTTLPQRSFPCQNDAYIENASPECYSGQSTGTKDLLARLPRLKLRRKRPPEAHSTIVDPLGRLEARLNWIHVAEPHFDGLHAIEVDWRNEALFRAEHLHKYEEHPFTRREARTLHSQVGEGDAIQPSMKNAFFIACLASRIEPVISKDQPSSGSKIALFFRVVANFVERVPRVRHSRQDPTEDAFHAFFFTRQATTQRTRSTRSSASAARRARSERSRSLFVFFPSEDERDQFKFQIQISNSKLSANCKIRH